MASPRSRGTRDHAFAPPLHTVNDLPANDARVTGRLIVRDEATVAEGVYYDTGALWSLLGGGLWYQYGDVTALTASVWADASPSFEMVTTQPELILPTAGRVHGAQVFTDDVAVAYRHRNLMMLELRARTGGTYGDYGAHGGAGFNSAYDTVRFRGFSQTPAELIGYAYHMQNYSMGDAAAGGGVTVGYGGGFIGSVNSGGLVRGFEHNSVSGNYQFVATLTGAPTTGATTLTYGSAANADTLGEYRELIDISLAYSTGTVTTADQDATVEGSGTTFTGKAGWFFRITADDETLGGQNSGLWYKILSVTDADTIELEVPYSGGTLGSGLSYQICPGAMVTAYDADLDAGTGTFTLEANSVAWAEGHTVHLRISQFVHLTPYVGIIQRYHKYLYDRDAVFSAVSTVRKAFTGFKLSSGTWRFGYNQSASATVDAAIDISKGTYTTDNAILLKDATRLSWGNNSDPTYVNGRAFGVDGNDFIWYNLDAAVMTLRATTRNLGVGNTAFDASAVNVLTMANGTAPSGGVADTVQFYSSDNAAGNTIPSFYCEGTDVVATGQSDSASSVRVKMRINGTVRTFLCI